MDDREAERTKEQIQSAVRCPGDLASDEIGVTINHKFYYGYRCSRRAAWRAPTREGAREAVARVTSAANLNRSEVMFAVPAFASSVWPALGVHFLAALARERSIASAILYGNLAFARIIGPRIYRRLCVTRTEKMPGERLFGPAHRGWSPAGDEREPGCWPDLFCGDVPSMADAQEAGILWADGMADLRAATSARAVGLTSSFKQTTPSLAFARRLTSRRPGRITLSGGADADGEMGLGLADYERTLDLAFQGQAEASFVAFLEELASGLVNRTRRVWEGQLLTDLDGIPTPDLTTFSLQFDASGAEETLDVEVDLRELRIPPKTRRGFWWGEKRHCTFRGLNASGMTYRIKSPERATQTSLGRPDGTASDSSSWSTTSCPIITSRRFCCS